MAFSPMSSVARNCWASWLLMTSCKVSALVLPMLFVKETRRTEPSTSITADTRERCTVGRPEDIPRVVSRKRRARRRNFFWRLNNIPRLNLLGVFLNERLDFAFESADLLTGEGNLVLLLSWPYEFPV